ncbi:WD40-repeat-containing domain protein [Tribonema minus]|uniref:Eukaryotic translation initiation factor 3 subunit I n=1 Tax=Tribonema minus TaxID=303371 RepID=A0A835ZF13_9STRA|nr:WD40-repeat-containing domain protein [Tribonema minus]
MRPILLKSHERAITCVIYNADGDLVFTAAKDNVPTVWRADTGERLGTYIGHSGAVWELSCRWDSKYLLSASADATVRLWDVQTGESLVSYPHRGPVRSVCWAEGGQKFVSASQPFMDSPGFISIYDTPSDVDPSQYQQVASREISIPNKEKCTEVLWSALNDRILASFEDGTIRVFDPETGELLSTSTPHSKPISRMYLSTDRTLLLTCSKDYTAKLLDADTLEVLKVYPTERPVNAAVIHPTKDHILLGGGQDAMSVTTTGSRVGKFETRFYHMIYEEEFGRVKGHFGPINALAINPDGLSYCSGAEDGYIRLHHFDREYVDKQDEVPDELEELDETEADQKPDLEE